MIAPPLLCAAMAALGACVGSFIATAVVRSVRGEPYLAGRSHCDACGRSLGLSQTVPVLSYVVSKGVCADCGSPISRLHPAAEIACAAVALGAVLQSDLAQALLVGALGASLLTASLVDAKTQLLPDALTFMVASAGAGLAWLKGGDQLWVGLATAALSFVILELLRRGFLRQRGMNGLGFGDVKLIAAVALWLGLRTPLALAAASLAGLAGFAFMRPVTGRLAFGPFIAGTAFVVGSAGSLPPWLA